MPFTGEIIVRPIAPEGKRWELTEPIEYRAKHETFTVPRGFTTDFASVPRVFVWLLPRYGKWTQAAILHDYLWGLARKKEFSKFDADGIFNRAMRELGVPYLRRWIMWTAVRWAAGPSTWFQGGPVPFLKMLLISVPTLAIVAVPVVAILVALLFGALCEFVAYLPLKLLHRDESKQVNAPQVGDVLTT